MLRRISGRLHTWDCRIATRCKIDARCGFSRAVACDSLPGEKLVAGKAEAEQVRQHHELC